MTATFVNRASGQEVARVTLVSREPVPVSLPVPAGETVLELSVDVVWVPKFVITGSEDPRELGIGVQDVELATGPGKARAPEARPPWAGALNRLRARRRAR